MSRGAGPIIFALLLSAASTLAQEPGSEVEAIQSRIMELDSLWLHGYLVDDVELVQGIVADDFLGIIDSFPVTKEDILAHAMEKDPDLRAYYGSDRVVTVHGSTAVIRGIGNAVYEGEEEPRFRWRYVDTYVWRNGRWQAVAIAVW